ncbi:DUF461 domain-containing protein [Streptomyces polygonati]|uniref:DUF461 domain-containing protein n=1 Tax=Streptomyces polygonati TaxID=1617087 RepID=A0ABV8HHD9_9ACTN
MVRSFRRAAFPVLVALSLAPLAACGAGEGARTLEVHPDSEAVSVGVIKVQNAFVLTQSSGPATVSARLFNNGTTAQTLQSLRLSGSLTARLTGAKGGSSITVPANGSVLLGGKGNPTAVIDSGAEALRDGDVQTAVFLFSGTGPVSLPVNVTPARGYFEAYGPGSLPASATPSPSASPSTTATPGSTDTATPTGTPTDTTTTTP